MKWTEEQYLEYVAKRKASDTILQDAKDDADVAPERELQDKIEAWCRERGYYFFHDHSRKSNVPGHPDLIVAMPGGRVLFLELKSKHGRLTSDQQRVKLMLMALGHDFHEIRSMRQFLEIASQVLLVTMRKHA